MRTTLRILVAGLSAATLSAPTAALATNGYQLIGIGSYQKSLGGAVTAKPGSTMTAISNPAGMARIGSRADFSLEAFMPERHVDFTGSGGVRAESAAEMYGVPALGWTAPISDENPDVFFGGGIYGTSGLGVDYASSLQAPAAFSPFSADTYYDGYSAISFWQMAPTLAWNPSERMSVGVSLNLNYQQVAFQQRFQVDTGAPTGPDTTVVNFDLARGAQAFGYGLSVGILFDVSEQLTLGASYKSKQLFPEMEYQLGFGDIQNVATPTGTPLSNCPVVGSNQICPAGRYELDLDYPQQIAAGLAYEFGPRWSVSADLKWIEWSDTLNEIVISGPNGTRVLLPAGWDDQVVYAVGVEFSPSDRLSLRAGYNYSESPIGDEDVDNNYILPGVVESHYTLGADYALNNRWALGFHYMYAPEVTFKSPVTNAEIGLSEQSVGVNIGYNF